MLLSKKHLLSLNVLYLTVSKICKKCDKQEKGWTFIIIIIIVIVIIIIIIIMC